MKNIKTFVAILLTAFLLNACRYPCGPAAANFALINFTDTTNDSIILRRFIKPGNFNQLKDSFIISGANASFERMHDTMLVLYNIPNEAASFGSVTSDFNYEVYIPKVNRLYKISDVQQDIQYGSRGGEKSYCLNPITSCRVDGKLKQGQRIDVIYLDN